MTVTANKMVQQSGYQRSAGTDSTNKPAPKPVYPRSSECDPSKWHFKEPQKNSAGGYSVYVKESETSKRDVHVLQGDVDTHSQPLEDIPYAPFGLYPVRQDNDSPDRRCLELAFTNPDDIAFYQKMDEAIIQAAVKNSVRWFGTKKDDSQVRMMYTPILRPPSEEFTKPDGTKVPAKPWYTVRATIMDTPEGHWERTQLFYVSYDENGKMQTKKGTVKNGIPRGSKVMNISRISSVTLKPKEISASLKYKHLAIWPGEERAMDSFAMFGLNVDYDEVSEDEGAPLPMDVDAAGAVDTAVPDNMQMPAEAFESQV